MSDTPSHSAVTQRLQVLLAGGGYNFYDRANQARADDLLVRQRASDALTQAAQTLRLLEVEYRRRFLPPATREQPYPPAGTMEKLRRLGQLRERLGGLESDIRGMAAPAGDKFWWRLRQETTLLHALIAFDDGLVGAAGDIVRLVETWTPDAWQAEDLAPSLTALIQSLAALVRDRQLLLLQPWG